MGDFFDISAEDRAYALGVFDDMLMVWGKPCKLFFNTTETVCPNCIINPNTGESTNRYKAGGPTPFVNGEICPVCEGRGRIEGTAETEVITMVIIWEPKNWMSIGMGDNQKLRVPGGMVVTRGMLSDLTKVLQCSTAVLDTQNTHTSGTFKLYGEPYCSGVTVKNRYFMAVWQRAG